MKNWQCWGLLLGLGPLLWLQGRWVRRVTPRLPEPPGPRAGEAGAGPLLRLLIAGDSAGAGVGADSQHAALSGQLVQALAAHCTVRWQLHAVTGLDSLGLQALLHQLPAQPFDVAVLSVGVNDVTALVPPDTWLQRQAALAQLLAERFAVRTVVHSAVPPMHHFSALPQPLRACLGAWAQAMNRGLAHALQELPADAPVKRLLHLLDTGSEPLSPVQALASDRFHPGPTAYAVWGQGLAQQILLSEGLQAP
ncbi:MAG: SGNH/GDSL hydrolase family protein [Rhodoferax sp.]|nr:MAG: SGNH/GDSL hydrolase family protein [Rhodoferax sp.]